MAEVEWKIEKSRSGANTLSVARRHAHSAYNPLAEAQQVASQVLAAMANGGHDSLISIGSGLGYITRAISEQWSGPILHWEPLSQLSEEIANKGFPHNLGSTREVLTAAANRGTGKRKKSPRHRVSVSTTKEFELALDALAGSGRNPYLWIHPGYEHVCRFEARYALRALRQRLVGQAKLLPRAAIVSQRSIEAASQLPFTPVTDDLADCLDSQTAIIISAGPSIHLANRGFTNHSGGVRFAGVRVLHELLATSSHVHFAVCSDLRNLFEIFGIPNDIPFDLLLADTSSEPKMLRDHRDRSCLFHGRTQHAHQLPWQASGLEILDEPIVSVSETSMLLAHRMGARRFILVGVDLDCDASRYAERFFVKNLAGETVTTNSHYFHSARYLGDYCSRLRDEGCEIFRLSDGLPIAGCQAIGVDEFETLIAALPSFTTPILPRTVHPGRLRATRRHYEWLTKNTGTSVRPVGGIEHSDPGWQPLDRAASLRLARRALRDLDGIAPERQAGSGLDSQLL